MRWRWQPETFDPATVLRDRSQRKMDFPVVVQFESSHLTIAMEAWKPASLKAMPPQSNIM
jgi:hypothetical protein